MDTAVWALVLPTFAAGILLTGFILFVLFAVRKPSPTNLSLVFMSFCALLFTAGEAATILFGNIFQQFPPAAQANRIQSIAVTFFIIAIPYFLRALTPMGPRARLLNRSFFYLGCAVTLIIVVGALLFPESFKSLTTPTATSVHRVLDLGRGQPGVLYDIRNAFLAVYMFYFLGVALYYVFTHPARLDLWTYVIAAVVASFFGFDDLWNDWTGDYLVFPELFFARFVTGISLFVIISMGAGALYFLEQADKVERTSLALEKSKEELVFLAFNDLLTGLPNRKSFYQKLEETLDLARRSGEARALFLLDLDNMKPVNDSLGLAVGDKFIQSVAIKIRTLLRATDYFFRLSGDEFAVILGETKNPTDSAFAAQKILTAVAQKTEIDGHVLYPSVSIGISIFPRDSLELKELVHMADTALQEAKKDRNSFRFYAESMHSEALNKISIINGLRNSLITDGFELHYQPLISLEGIVVGAEALLRWQTPELGRIPPDVFIPLAESTGLINSIGTWVLRKAMEDSLKLNRAGFSLFLSINLSAKQLKDPKLLEIIETHMSASGVTPDAVHLEITETSLVEGREEYRQVLDALNRRGLNLVIDDFGVGYSSLSYLKSLPVKTLKIDKSFISPLPDGLKDAAIVKSIIDLAKGLDLQVVAEGVETLAQRDFLFEQQCHMIQGYYYSKPLPFAVFLEYLARPLQDK